MGCTIKNNEVNLCNLYKKFVGIIKQSRCKKIMAYKLMSQVNKDREENGQPQVKNQNYTIKKTAQTISSGHIHSEIEEKRRAIEELADETQIKRRRGRPKKEPLESIEKIRGARGRPRRQPIPIDEKIFVSDDMPFEKTIEIQNDIASESLESLDKIDFHSGINILSIRLSKKENRMYRIQIFLNDKIEIRPVTYVGASTGLGFWNMLKGVLKQ